MQGNPITKSEFDLYLENELDNGLKLLDMNLRSPAKRQQVAARFLGYNSYEALAAQFDTAEALTSEVCETYYSWLRPITEDGKTRYIHLDASEYDMNISSLNFSSREEAYEAIEDDRWGWQADELYKQNAVLMKVTLSDKQSLKHLDDKNEDNEDLEYLEHFELDTPPNVPAKEGITMGYVIKRHADFVVALGKAMAELGHTEEKIAEYTSTLKSRLKKKDYKLDGDDPIHHLHGGKRITRNLISTAIMISPAEVKRKEQVRKRYEERCEQERKKSFDPNISFFSFKAPLINKSKYKNLFYI
ncbi:hypothetical protein VCHA53O466_40449 [Vibrio chagasii]|nr:hypothetical protein VCHA53O466_40449 [Vibrio chagasii]